MSENTAHAAFLLARMMLSDHLQECGFVVFEAANADEAIHTIESGIPIDLVLTDIRMPASMNGFGHTDRTGKRTL